MNEKNSLLLRQKRPQKEFGYQLFFALATTAIFKRCNTQAYQNFFKSTQGNRKGKPIRPPKFKKRMSLPTQDLQRVDFNLAN